MKRIPTFLAGMLTMALIGSVSVGALAATGQFTITVDPVKVQVNGETFQPKDEKGNDVPVFAYQGTTYAPLRALAEAYGLEVGYDVQAKMATVGASAPASEAPPPTNKLGNQVKDFEQNGIAVILNGDSIANDAPPLTLTSGGRLYVNARLLCSELGLDADSFDFTHGDDYLLFSGDCYPQIFDFLVETSAPVTVDIDTENALLVISSVT